MHKIGNVGIFDISLIPDIFHIVISWQNMLVKVKLDVSNIAIFLARYFLTAQPSLVLRHSCKIVESEKLHWYTICKSDSKLCHS